MLVRQFSYLDIGRGLAALLVVFHHATLDSEFFYNYVVLNNFFYFGKAGVDFFFVLSGFIIYYMHAEDTNDIPTLKRYLLKRVIRVYPLFWIISLCMLCGYLFLPALSDRIDLNDIQLMITSFLLLPNSSAPLLTVSWTLVYEIFFYMVFLLFIFNRQLGIILLVVWVGLILYVNIFPLNIAFPLNIYLNIYNMEFIFGLIIGILVKKEWKKDINFKWILVIGISIFILNGITVSYNFFMLNHVVVQVIYGLSSSLIIWSLVCMKNVIYKGVIFKFFIFMGMSSYSIYLTHRPIQSILHRIIDRINLEEIIHYNIIFLCVIILSVLLGMVTYIIIEKPMLQYLKKKLL